MARDRRRDRARLPRILRRRGQHGRVRRRHAAGAAGGARRRPAGRRHDAGAVPRRLPRQPTEGVPRHPRPRSGARLPARARDRLRGRPPVHGLRGRRARRRPADHRPGRPPGAAGTRPMNLLAPKVAAAKAVGTLVRASGRGGGTSLPGKVLTRLEPHAIRLLAGRLPQGSVVISATNGKTTTAAMVASVLDRTGARLVHNRAGANMAGGVASALAAAARRGGRTLDGDLGLFEVDEFWLGPVTEELQPRAMLLGNLFRDQLDRYGELETIADRWAAVVARTPAALVLNADDPLVADLGRGRDAVGTAKGGHASGGPPRSGRRSIGAGRCVYFGVDDDSLALPEL